MFNMYVNDKLFALVRDTADACRIPVADVLRKVGQWVKSGRIQLGRATHSAAVCDPGKRINPVVVPMGYLNESNNAKHRIKAEMDAPKLTPEQFRVALAAACLDTMQKFAVNRAMEGLNAHYINGADYRGAFVYGAEAAR